MDQTQPQPMIAPIPPVSPVYPISKSENHAVMWISAGAIILTIGIGIGLMLGKYLPKPKQITSYEECVKANGNAIQPMYPGVCTVDGQRFDQPIPTPLPAEASAKEGDPTANWKTYANIKNDYSFKYPSDWELDYYQGSSSKLTPKELSESDYVSIGKFTSDGQHGYSISVSGNQSQMGKSLSCKSDISDPNCLKQFLDSPPIPNYQIVKLGQTPAIKFLERPLDYPTIVFVKNGTLIKVTYTPNPYQNLEPIVSQILFTFKFMDQNSDPEGKFCGGIAANLPQNQCPAGYTCKLDGNYPDASGVCVKN